MSRPIFTEEMDQIIRDRYPQEGAVLCELLGVLITQLRNRASRLGVRFIPRGYREGNKERKEWQNQQIFSLYPIHGPNEVARILGLSRQRVKSRASELGVVYENRWNRLENKINDCYFKGEITDNMAYVLGYIWADGSVIQRERAEKPNLLRFACHVKDKDILEKVLLELGSNHELKYIPPYLDKAGNKGGNCVKCDITNVTLVEPLVERFGIIPRKSFFDCEFPSYIPEDKWNHFCRGNLDGDGGFGHDKRSPLDVGYRVRWCGNDLFMEGLRNLLVCHLGVREVKVQEDKISKTGLLRHVVWTSVKDFLTIGEFLYPEGNGYLYGDRKRAYFEKARELILYGEP